MNLKEKMEKFNRRWNIESDETPEQSFLKFKTRILNILEDIDQHVTEESVAVFCQFYGIKEVWHTASYGDRSWSTNIVDRLKVEVNEKEFYKLIEIIFSLHITSTIGYDHRYTYSKEILFGKISEAINYSNVNVAIGVSDDEVILYPKGEEELDIQLVNFPLSFLNKESGEHLVQALQFYQEKNHIKSAESLRRSLEEFLRYKLKNTKGLDANITELQKKIKTDGRDPKVRSIIGTTFTFLDQYFNENSKHNDGDIDESENEFLIYQTGLLLRYVNKVIQ